MCDAVNEDGLHCQKKGLHSGHMYASDEVWKSLTTDHFDYKALVSGQPASHHSPAKCPGPPTCIDGVIYG